MEKQLLTRAQSECEMCRAKNDLSVYEIPPVTNSGPDKSILVCGTCLSQIEGTEALDFNHWRALSETMWSEHAPVQVMAYRMLRRLSSEGWAQDLIDQLYLEEELLNWAQAEEARAEMNESSVPTKDSNGTQLLDGDTVTLIKDLVVKGANFTAKRGTVVKNISLTSNPLHIEGKVNGTQIVLVADFLKKVTS